MSDKNKKQLSTEQERSIYASWEVSGLFHADPTSDKDPFTIMIPPPNVTGDLHLGHGLTMTLQDILTRSQRMRGKDTLWQPGTDHAGIATQLIVERQLGEEGTSSKEMGREKFLERVWEWKEKSGGSITNQLRRLGASLDWKRERFTMDDGLQKSVREAFIKLYNDGLIKRGERLVNWDPKFQSAISDLEVNNIETQGNMWHFKYPLDDAKGEFITIATTRPETMLGDVAIAVHPDDERYTHLIGKYAVLPLVGRKIPIIADEYSDPEKGSGAVKITPAHDFNDFGVGERHDLPKFSILDKKAAVTLEQIKNDLTDIDGVANIAFVQSLESLDRFKARKTIVAEMEKLGFLVEIEQVTNQVPRADRGNEIVEPFLTTQWFFDVSDLATQAIQCVKDGDLEFVPKQWENTFFAWLGDIQPWCISRQLWWGHRIPAWYGPDGEIFVADDEAGALAQAKTHYGQDTALTQDDDVLDTWFSSGLWPFSTLGWPDQTPELDKYFPGNVLVTGFDIIFFWVARMVMMSLHFHGTVPFKTVIMHGLVRDEKGKKMSKTSGNGIDPIEAMDEFGADALRWTICSQTGMGRDIKMGKKTIENGRNFITKLNNAVAFWEMNGLNDAPDIDLNAITNPMCQWMIAQANIAIDQATKALDTYRFDEYANAIYQFVQNDFCDWFIELSKNPLKTDQGREILATAKHMLNIVLRLMHPVAPYTACHLWGKLGFGGLNDLLVEAWPTAIETADNTQAIADTQWAMKFIVIVRNIRAEMNIPYSNPMNVLLQNANAETLRRAQDWQSILQQLVKISTIEPLEGDTPEAAAQGILDEVTLVFPLDGAIDLSAEKERLTKKHEKLSQEITKLQGRLSNQAFVDKAPEKVVNECKAELASMEEEQSLLTEAIAKFG